jgi:hypothetical protein
LSIAGLSYAGSSWFCRFFFCNLTIAKSRGFFRLNLKTLANSTAWDFRDRHKLGDCFDNACAETFFHTLKVELTHGVRYETREQLRPEVFEYIELYYNTVCRHSTLGYISPAAFGEFEVA